MSSDSAPFCLVAGFSMLPLLRSGDRVFMQPAERNEIAPGDIVVFSRGGKQIVHRVIRTGEKIQTQGDGNPRPDDPLEPEAELFLCSSFERDGVVTPLTRGDAGLAEFRRNQSACRQRERRLKAARTLCRLLPFKLHAENLKQTSFGDLKIFYRKNRPVAYEKDGRWRWNTPLDACFIKPAPRQTLLEKEQLEMRFASTLFGLLREMVFGDPRKYFSSLPGGVRNELCSRGRLQGLSPLFYYTLTDALPPEWFPVFKLDFHTQSQHAFRYHEALNRLQEEFRALGTPFIPLKGSSLAGEVYPHPALRLWRDIDLLFRRAEVEKVYSALLQQGWEPERQRHPFFKRHHLPTLTRKGFPALELHWHILKNRTFFDPETLWTPACSTPERSDALLRRLTPEAHYLLVLYNMFFDRWQFACRALLDLAYLQKKYPLDRERIAALNREWNLNLDLGLCYRLFPEMFPEEQRLFSSEAEIPERAFYAVRRLALIEYPEAIVPFLAGNTGAPLPEIPKKHHGHGLFRRRRKKRSETEKLRELLTRLLPQATALKTIYRQNKDQ